MTTSVDQAGLERRFTEMLAAARRRVHRSVLRALMLVAIDRALLSVVCVACTYCLLRFVCLVIGSAAPIMPNITMTPTPR